MRSRLQSKYYFEDKNLKIKIIIDNLILLHVSPPRCLVHLSDDFSLELAMTIDNLHIFNEILYRVIVYY